MKVLLTNINEITTISTDIETLEHPFSEILDFQELKKAMEEYEKMFPSFKNLRFIPRYEYTKQPNSRYGVTREWYDLVGDYDSALMEELD